MIIKNASQTKQEEERDNGPGPHPGSQSPRGSSHPQGRGRSPSQALVPRPPALRLSLRPWRRAQKQRPWGTSQFPSQSRLLRARPGAQVPPGAEAADGGGGEVQRAGLQERRSWEGDAGVEKGGRHRTDAKWSSDRGT